MSNVWYSSEVAGTIMVQCIPVLRPFLREVHASLTSKRLTSTGDGRRSVTWLSKPTSSKHRISELNFGTNDGFNFGFNETKCTGAIELKSIHEESRDDKSVKGWH